jgi:hypothetical protein
LVLRRVEAREMLSDDLVQGVALDAFGTRVPARNMSLRIEHEDGVIHDRLDQLLVSAAIEPARFDAFCQCLATLTCARSVSAYENDRCNETGPVGLQVAPFNERSTCG